MANKNISILLDAARAASRFLYRDYAELENLQTSLKGTQSFVENSRNRVLEKLRANLEKHYPNIIFSPEADNFNSINGYAILVDIISGINNFARALPYFGVVVTLVQGKENTIIAEKTVINLPIVGELYYAEKSKGAWLEKDNSGNTGSIFRIRTSANTKISECLLACENVQQAANLDQHFLSIRIFGCSAYQAALVAAGKIDCCVSEAHSLLNPGLELLVREAGGAAGIKNNLFFASNYHLHDKITEII